MAQSSACHTPLKIPPLSGKNELAGVAHIEDNKTPFISPAYTFATTIALPVVFALYFIAWYLEDDFQQIFSTVLDSRPLPLFIPALIVAQQYKSPCKRLLKAWFLEIYRDKTYMECYNFF